MDAAEEITSGNYKSSCVVAIESSCDETAVAVVGADKEIKYNALYTQAHIHSEYGGVVPEIAARNHVAILPKMLKDMIAGIDIPISQVSAIAVTSGPGLIGGVIIGVMAAKGLASVLNKPCIPINHLAGHALSVRLKSDIQFPYLLLLMSGGHCQILIVRGASDYDLIGSTLDDAPGEAFDKVAKLLDLGYPGGPAIEKLALKGDSHRFDFPRPMYKQDGCNFSFSGLKTAVRRCIERLGGVTSLDQETKADICASFQRAMAQAIADRLDCAINKTKHHRNERYRCVAVAGGVAANRYIYEKLLDLCRKHQFELFVPPVDLCTDNAAMIAWAGIEVLKEGCDLRRDTIDLFRDLSFEPRSRWSLT